MKQFGLGIIGGGIMGRAVAAAVTRWPELIAAGDVTGCMTIARLGRKSVAWFGNTTLGVAR